MILGFYFQFHNSNLLQKENTYLYCYLISFAFTEVHFKHTLHYLKIILEKYFCQLEVKSDFKQSL